jgi:hypothetical protein
MKNNRAWFQICRVRMAKTALAMLAICALGTVGTLAQTLFWNTNDASAIWTNANWSTVDGGPFTAAWTNGDIQQPQVNQTLF